MEAEDGLVGGSMGTEAETMRDGSINNNEEEADDVEPTNKELEHLQKQLFGAISVRAKRQTEQKARRARAAERASTNILFFKSGSSSSKKCAAMQEVDYTDPLRYLRATTSTTKLLSPTEEPELSERIQDLLKLEKLQDDLVERCGSPPTIAQWATAAGVDQKTLRKRLNYGTFSKDKVIKSNIRLVISIAKNLSGSWNESPRSCPGSMSRPCERC